MAFRDFLLTAVKQEHRIAKNLFVDPGPRFFPSHSSSISAHGCAGTRQRRWWRIKMNKKFSFTLAVVLLMAAVVPSYAQVKKARTWSRPTSPAAPSGAPTDASVKRGDPPPGDAMSLSVPEAQDALKNAIGKRYTGHMSSCQRSGLFRFCTVWTLSPAANVQVSATEFAFAAPYTTRVYGARRPTQDAGQVSFNLKKTANYLQVYPMGSEDPRTSYEPKVFYAVGFLPAPQRAGLSTLAFSWLEEADARAFANAFNRLAYAANRDENFPAFAAAAKAWRENPAKPPIAPEAEKRQALAEKALDEQNLDAAIENYEKAVQIQPMWPEAWYSLALLYGEQNNYAGAANCMRHYLELAPDATDSDEAREKLAAWEGKGRPVAAPTPSGQPAGQAQPGQTATPAIRRF
jgi:hypothetical protein